MEILLWLVPPLIVTALAMGWVSWLGREGRGEIDHDEAVRRLTKAMQRDSPALRKAGTRELPDRSTGVAVRRPVQKPAHEPASQPVESGDHERHRHAS